MQPAPSGKVKLEDSRGTVGIQKGTVTVSCKGHFPCRNLHSHLSFLPQKSAVLTKVLGLFWYRKVLFRDFQTASVARNVCWVQRTGLGSLLIQTVVSLRQEMKAEAAKLWCGSTLFCTVQDNITVKQHLPFHQSLPGIISQTQILGISDAFQQHVWKHRQERSE